MKQMCEHIESTGVLVCNDGSKPTAVEIFNYSSTGELWKVFIWFDMACKIKPFIK